MTDSQVFKHVIGKSSLEEGFTVSRAFEGWIGAPAKGDKRVITLLYGNSSISAILRRINNERGHVQIKYEGASGLGFREWLKTVFNKSASLPCGEYIEVHKIDLQTFRVVPFPLKEKSDTLVVHDWLLHKNADSYESGGALSEIQAIVQGIEFIETEGQAHYNEMFANQFSSWAWNNEKRVVPELGLKSDFEKDGAWVEVEFGNARTYYQDFLKFMIAFHHGTAQIGILVVPSESFAKHLCNVGRQRAEAKGRGSYSGMIHFEKVKREFQYLEFMLSMPIAIAGIGCPK